MSDPIPYTESHSYPSYAQAGEDRIVYSLFEMLGSDHKLRYADVGAAAPAGHNNTYLFYTLGGSGLLVEADPDYLPAYAAVRPRDAVENVAIVPERLRKNDSITFFAMHDRGWSTVSEEHRAVADRLGKGSIRTTFAARTATLNEVLAKHFADGRLDLLSLDIEGVDTEVLTELDLRRFRPSVIVYEDPNRTFDQSRKQPYEQKLGASGYSLFAFTPANVIYVDRTVLSGARV